MAKARITAIQDNNNGQVTVTMSILRDDNTVLPGGPRQVLLAAADVLDITNDGTLTNVQQAARLLNLFKTAAKNLKADAGDEAVTDILALTTLPVDVTL